MTDDRQCQVDDSARQSADVHDLAGQHEERDRQQRKTVGTIDQILGEDLRIEEPQVPHQRHAADQQRKCNRDADCHRAEQGAEKDEDGHSSSSDSRTMMRSCVATFPVANLNRSYSMMRIAETANTTPLA